MEAVARRLWWVCVWLAIACLGQCNIADSIDRNTAAISKQERSR